MKKAFEAYMKRQRISPSDWFLYWQIWKAAAQWQRKHGKE